MQKLKNFVACIDFHLDAEIVCDNSQKQEFSELSFKLCI